jgi:flagellar biosynthesis anti-sigma factor FlgM
MKVNDPNISSGLTSGTTGSSRTDQVGRQSGSQRSGGAGATSSDDVHLSELVRSLRSLAADSPERQAKIEQLARTYASGSYRPDANATASAMIEDAFKR